MSTPWPTLAHSYYHLSPPPTSNPLSSIRIWLLHSHIYQSKSNKTLALDVSSYAKLVNCVRDMDAWMLSNKLKLNKDKSEVLVISSSYRPRPPLSSVDICNETVSCSLSPFVWYLISMQSVNRPFSIFVTLVSYANILLMMLQRSLIVPL